MKKMMILLLLVVMGASAFTEELIDIFTDNFNKANLITKLQILQDCVKKDISDRGILFNKAIFFIINNYKSIGEQGTSKDIATLSISQIDSLLYKPAKTALWDLFLIESTARVKMSILRTLSHIANDDQDIIKKINGWLDVQNEQYKISKSMDLQIISTCIEALGTITDPSSFSPIFLVSFSGYPDTIKKQAEDTLPSIKGSLKDHYINLLQTATFAQKRYTIERGLLESRLNTTEKCEVAYEALKIAVNSIVTVPDERNLARDIRNMAIVFIGNNGYSEAVDFGIMHLKMTLEEYTAKRVPSSGVLPVLKALGELKSHAAAVELKNYLDTINGDFEDGKPYDEQITLQVISSLEKLGDKVARSSLLYVGYLRYSDKIKKAADTAFNAIK
jgi:hypothetical protein